MRNLHVRFSFDRFKVLKGKKLACLEIKEGGSIGRIYSSAIGSYNT